MIRCYRELIILDTFEARYRYLKLSGRVAESTFSNERFLNQMLYRSAKWRRTRDKVVLRDNGCDLAIPGREIYSRLIVHHMNPLTPEQIENDDPIIYETDLLICTTNSTHLAIHFSDEHQLSILPKERYKNDMCPWR